jgi:dolichol-phosphate mannosyltransferase
MNEAENIPLLFERLSLVLKDSPYSFEYIFVDDGSEDETWLVIGEVVAKSSKTSGLRLSRNFGHASALEAGLKLANGDAVIMMDADLQHPPELLPRMIELWEQGAEVVNTVRVSTEKESFFKKQTSKAFYSLINRISDIRINPGEADFRLLDKKAHMSLNALPESPKFYRGLTNWLGFSIRYLEFSAPSRKHGKSSYSLAKMVELARLGITSFSRKPLKIIAAIGFLLITLSTLLLIAMLTVKFFIDTAFFSNLSILVVFVVLVTGFLTAFQGIIAIYLVDIFQATKGRPAYIIKEIAGKKSVDYS